MCVCVRERKRERERERTARLKATASSLTCKAFDVELYVLHRVRCVVVVVFVFGCVLFVVCCLVWLC